MKKILCIEDAKDTQMMVGSTLKEFQISYASSIKEAHIEIKKDNFDLVLLDIGLPDGNGIDFMKFLAEEYSNTPVIFITGSKDFSEKTAAFASGADDFIEKPFDPRELKLRVEAKIRKADVARQSSETIKVGNIVCNIPEQRMWITGATTPQEPVSLTSIEFRLFMLLAKAKNRVFTRTEILERVWGSEMNVTDRAVDVHISNLRKKLQHSGVTIESVVGAGYRLSV